MHVSVMMRASDGRRLRQSPLALRPEEVAEREEADPEWVVRTGTALAVRLMEEPVLVTGSYDNTAKLWRLPEVAE